MSIVDMAKAHLQNVHLRVEELQSKKKIIEDEINKLSAYIAQGLQDIQDQEEEDKSVDVSNK
jgi:hypothetical protein